MKRWRADLISILAGTAAGAAVLGVDGRLAMAILPGATGARPRFSWGGSLEVVVLGTGYGLLGGFLLAIVRRTRPMLFLGHGASLGLLLLGIA